MHSPRLNLSLRQVEIFLAIAKHQSISRAASELLLSQSAVSMALQEMERQTRGPLFDRIGRRTILNDRGRLLLPMAVELSDRILEMQQTLAGEDAGTVLNISASSTIGNYLLPSCIARFAGGHPDLHIRLHIGNTEETIQRVQDFTSDIGFIEGQCNHPELHSTVWRDDKLLLLVSSSHPLIRRNRIRIKDLFDYPWILREKGSGTRTILEQALGSHIHSLRIRLELGHTEAIKNALAESHAISCLSAEAARKEISLGLLQSLSLPRLNLRRKLYVIRHKRRYVSRTLRQFLDEVS